MTALRPKTTQPRPRPRIVELFQRWRTARRIARRSAELRSDPWLARDAGLADGGPPPPPPQRYRG
ncbi:MULTISPECIES: hypothetical protein [unclassified Salipiger]|uniref:hypothetical protein n=1 Tax=unclassified Salipiger TaxID=2640570 RepID=UPI0013BDB5F3|nr:MULTISPECIES: hypothetical protein [unclassified Salipiger]NDV51586.1 hypothetical protein [Salipiger sp. PrR003]NDW33820.1 hypothetical protein [Salipiger sp. PrR007]